MGLRPITEVRGAKFGGGRTQASELPMIESRADRVQQGVFAEWLAQEFNSTKASH